MWPFKKPKYSIVKRAIKTVNYEYDLRNNETGKIELTSDIDVYMKNNIEYNRNREAVQYAKHIQACKLDTPNLCTHENYYIVWRLNPREVQVGCVDCGHEWKEPYDYHDKKWEKHDWFWGGNDE